MKRKKVKPVSPKKLIQKEPEPIVENVFKNKPTIMIPPPPILPLPPARPTISLSQWWVFVD